MGRPIEQGPAQGQRPDQFRAGASDPGEPSGPKTRTASFDGKKLPWMNGQVVSTNLSVVQANGNTLLTGSIEATYAGVGGLAPEDVPQAKSAYDRLAETVLQNGSVRTDDCLTTGRKGDPSVLVSMIGHNARRTSTFVYAVDTRMGEGQDRHFLWLGASTGEKRKDFEKGLRRAGYESNKGQGRNFR